MFQLHGSKRSSSGTCRDSRRTEPDPAVALEEHRVPAFYEGKPCGRARESCPRWHANRRPRLLGWRTRRLVLNRASGNLRSAGTLPRSPTARRCTGVVGGLLLRRSPRSQATSHAGSPESSGGISQVTGREDHRRISGRAWPPPVHLHGVVFDLRRSGFRDVTPPRQARQVMRYFVT